METEFGIRKGPCGEGGRPHGPDAETEEERGVFFETGGRGALD